MPPIRREIRFWLNDQLVTLDSCKPTETLLDFLRLKRGLTGSKEGCAEGDCGACTILVGRLLGGDLVYESVNSCIRFLPSLDGCHIVTIEALRGSDGNLHPIQQAMVDYHGSQCGFCTPGIIMSLYALWMREQNPTRSAIEKSLQGNLCRCTGYRPIIDAAMNISSYGTIAHDWLETERQSNKQRLEDFADGTRLEVGIGDARAILPADLDDLSKLRLEHPETTIIAGGTDVGLWVTKHMHDFGTVLFVGHLEELKTLATTDTHLTIGAGATYSEAQDRLLALFPHLEEYWWRIAGEQIRNMGTIGGNIANGSPIGDMPPVLIALGAELILRQGEMQRQMPLEDFFIDYGKQDRQTGDFVEAIRVPMPKPDTLHGAYKISKRRDEDISSVAAAFYVTIEQGLIKEARIAFGGMAATPKRATHAEEALRGQPFDLDALIAASETLDKDFQPISDMRASSSYRMMVAKNLFRQFWHDQKGTSEGVAAE